MAHFYMDDYFQEFSKYLADNYAKELINGDIESIYEDLIDENNEADVTNDLADLFKEAADRYYTYTLQVFFFYYLLYLLGPKNVKLKWFKLIWDRDTDRVAFGISIQLECRRVYDLDESNFDDITDVNLGELNFIRNIKLPSTIKHFEIDSIWDNRKYNIIDLSNISKDFFISSSREWHSSYTFTEKGIKISDSCITKVILPPNLEIIPDRFFSYCWKLKEITLPASLTKIGSMAFEGCESLREINYLGTKEQWKQMSRPTSWRRESAIERVNCSDGVIILTKKQI